MQFGVFSIKTPSWVSRKFLLGANGNTNPGATMHLFLTIQFALGLLTGLALITTGAERHLWDAWGESSEETY